MIWKYIAMVMVFAVLSVDSSYMSSGPVCPRNCTCGNSSTSLSILCNKYTTQITADQINDILQSMSTKTVTSIMIQNTSLTEFPARICKFVALTHLVFQHNNIVQLPDNCFCKMKRLNKLYLGYNKIRRLQDRLFDGLPALSRLKLKFNDISKIGLRVFHNESELRNLTYLDLMYNRLESIDNWPFVRGYVGGRRSLQVIIRVGRNPISRFTNELNLTFNCRYEAYKIAKLVFNTSGCNYSRITDIGRGWGVDLLRCLCKFRNFDASNAYCLATICADHNPLVCDCRDFDFYRTIENYQMTSLLNKAICHMPPELRGQDVTTVELNQFTCRISDQCPDECSECLFRPDNSSLELHCPSTNYSTLPDRIPPLTSRGMRYALNFSNSVQLESLDWRPYFANVSVIDVSSCAISTIDEELLNDTHSIRELLLHNNRLEHLPKSIQNGLSSDTKLSLGNNSWSCTCDDAWMIDWLNKVKDQLIDKIEIQCYTPERLRGKSLLRTSSDEFCFDPSTQNMWRFLILGASVCFVVLLTLAALVYRVRVLLYRKWNFHPFDRDECVGEQMTYDVFLCSSSKDHAVHSVHILEELESRGFKVCYHERDFLAGENIDRNICVAIEQSKRTLCLISEHFLNSQYCMREFDISLHHNVTYLRKKRLILLMLINDPSTMLSSSSDLEALRQYIRQYTYIDRKSKNWLDQLAYALPINGMLQHQNETTPLLQSID